MTCADPGGRQPLGDRRAISAGPRLDPDTTVWASTDAGFGRESVDAHTPERLLRYVTVIGHGSRARSAQWSTAYGQRMRAAFDAYPVDLSGRWRRRPGQVLDVTLLVCALSQTWVGPG